MTPATLFDTMPFIGQPRMRFSSKLPNRGAPAVALRSSKSTLPARERNYAAPKTTSGIRCSGRLPVGPWARAVLVGLVGTSMALFADAHACEADESDGTAIVLGYYPGYEKFDQKKIPWQQLTHLCHAFLTSDAEGVVEPNPLVPSAVLTAAGRDHNVPVILSIGGWGDADGFEQATSTPEKMTKWIDDVSQIVVQHGYAGLDVDWEFPTDESTKNRFTQLLLALRRKFDQLESQTGVHLLITSAVTARPAEGMWIDGPAIEPAIDFLNVMTYDFSGPWVKLAAHHAPLKASPEDPEAAWRSVEQAMAYWENKQGFPKRKLNVGIPLYGRKFPVRRPYADLADLPEEGFGTPEYKAIVQLQKSGWTRIDDPDCHVPWLVAPAGKQGLIAYDDPQSVEKKSQWAKANGYRGIFFWAIGHDYLPSDEQPLVEAATRHWLP